MTRTTWAPLLLAAAVAMLTACNSTPKAEGSGMLIEPADAQRMGYLSQWATDLAAPQGIEHVAILGDVIITVENSTNLVSAVNLRDGSVRWRRVVGESLSDIFMPTRTDKLILVNSERGYYALDAETGRLVSQHELVGPVSTSPAIANDTAVFGGLTGRVFAQGVNSGFQRWAYQMASGVAVPPILIGNSVVVADTAGNVVAIEAETGTLLWRARAHERVTANLVATTQTVYVPSHDQSFYAINRLNGRDRWVYRAGLPLDQSPKLLGNSLYLPLPRTALVCLDPTTGAEVWRNPTDARPLTLVEQRLLLWTPTSLMYVDNQSGKPVAEVPTDTLSSVLVGPDNSLVLVARNGRLQRLNTR